MNIILDRFFIIRTLFFSMFTTHTMLKMTYFYIMTRLAHIHITYNVKNDIFYIKTRLACIHITYNVKDDIL